MPDHHESPAELLARLKQTRAELEPISSRIHEMMLTNGLHRSARRKALKLALVAYDALADEYSELVARYNALILGHKPPE